MAEPRTSKEFLGKSRVEALTDGIFAFALTLLVMNIEVPAELPNPLPAEPVISLLNHLIPDFAHFFFAFIVLAGFWVSHHMLFSRIRYVDRTLTWLNIAGLVFIALVPFSAQLADTYVDYPLAAIVFETNILIIGLIYYSQWLHAKGDGDLMDGRMDPADASLASKRMLIMPVISAVALVFAASGITWTTVLYILSPIALIILTRKR